jgi:hypothetical protein
MHEKPDKPTPFQFGLVSLFAVTALVAAVAWMPSLWPILGIMALVYLLGLAAIAVLVFTCLAVASVARRLHRLPCYSLAVARQQHNLTDTADALLVLME